LVFVILLRSPIVRILGEAKGLIELGHEVLFCTYGLSAGIFHECIKKSIWLITVPNSINVQQIKFPLPTAAWQAALPESGRNDPL
jgi:hypothetical protein